MIYSAIAAAYSALSPVPASLTIAAALLNAQAASLTVDVPAAAVRDYLLTTGEWGSLMLAIAPGSIASTAIQAIVLSLKTLVDTGATIHATIPAVQTSAKAWLGDLQSASLISTTTVAGLEALWTQTASVWPQILSVGDLQTALGML